MSVKSQPQQVDSDTGIGGNQQSNHDMDDEDSKLRLVDEDLFRKGKKNKKKREERKSAVSPMKPPSKVVKADETIDMDYDDGDFKSSGKTKSKSDKPKQHENGRRCIVQMCGRVVTVGGG